jgi:hypothetical protein
MGYAPRPPEWGVLGIWGPSQEVLVQGGYDILVTMRLDVTVRVGRLADRGVAHLLLNPPKVRLIAQKPGGERVATAGLFVCPLRFGSGVKNTILAALAMANRWWPLA